LAGQCTIPSSAAISHTWGRVEMVSVLTDLIKDDEDRIMIIDMGPVDGRVAERIEFLGVHPEENGREEKVIIE
jgi:CRISPR-associated protein Cas2